MAEGLEGLGGRRADGEKLLVGVERVVGEVGLGVEGASEDEGGGGGGLELLAAFIGVNGEGDSVDLIVQYFFDRSSGLISLWE